MMARCGLLTLLLALQAPLPRAFLCSLTTGAVVKWFPKGYRDAVGRFNNKIGCTPASEDFLSRSASLVKTPRSEDEGYLRGLEHPGIYFRMDLAKVHGEKAGFSVSRVKDYLEVDTVHQNGAMATWNEEQPAKAVHGRDRVIIINGVEGDSTLMFEELKKAVNQTEVSMHIFRTDTRDRTAIDAGKKEKEVNKILQEPGPQGLGQGIPEPAGSPVATLHAGNIDRFVASAPYALVMFYASWCGHCRELAPEYREAAELVAAMDLPALVRFAKFDDGDEANRHRYQAGNKFNYTSFPSLFWFKNGIHEGFYNTNGAPEISAHVAALAKGLDPEEEIKKALLISRPMIFKPDTNPEDVRDLEPETFDDVVLQESKVDNNRVWIVMYYSDKCPFCKTLKPEYIKAAEKVRKELDGKVRFAGVNSRAFQDLAERFGVTSYPWIASFYAGGKIEDMAGLGGWESVYNWAKAMHSKAWKKKAPKWKVAPPLVATKKTAEDVEAGKAAAANRTDTWRELIGQRTWFLMHSMMAQFPESPSDADAEAMRSFIAGMGQLYPCPSCRWDLQGKLMPGAGKVGLGHVPTKTRSELTLWLCRLHNKISYRLNKPKPLFKCNATALDEFYLSDRYVCGDDEDAAKDPKGKSWDFFKYLGDNGGKRKA